MNFYLNIIFIKLAIISFISFVVKTNKVILQEA